MPTESRPLKRAYGTLALPPFGPRSATAEREAGDEKRKPFPVRYREPLRCANSRPHGRIPRLQGNGAGWRTGSESPGGRDKSATITNGSAASAFAPPRGRGRARLFAFAAGSVGCAWALRWVIGARGREADREGRGPLRKVRGGRPVGVRPRGSVRVLCHSVALRPGGWGFSIPDGETEAP